MQGQIIDAPRNGTCARPASGSAFLAGHVVTVTVPAMTMGIGLLAIGEEWKELHVPDRDDQNGLASGSRQPTETRRP